MNILLYAVPAAAAVALLFAFIKAPAVTKASPAWPKLPTP